MEEYFLSHPAPPGDVEKMKLLMLHMGQNEFDHVMMVRVGLDKSPGHLLCYCSGDKPHRVKDCPKVPGGSKCSHLITKGKNKGGFKKKSSCPECCPKNFCYHKLRRDNCQKCKVKRKGHHGKSLMIKVPVFKQEMIPMVHPVPSNGVQENMMTLVNPQSSNSYLFEDLHIVQDVPGPIFHVQGLDVEDFPLFLQDEDIEDVEDFQFIDLEDEHIEDGEDFPLGVFQDDQDGVSDDVQHVPFLEEGSHF